MIRSLNQNAFYWAAIVTPYATAKGMSPEQVHHHLKEKFLTVDKVDRRTGEVIGQRVMSTTELSVRAFSVYCEQCREYLERLMKPLAIRQMPRQTHR